MLATTSAAAARIRGKVESRKTKVERPTIFAFNILANCCFIQYLKKKKSIQRQIDNLFDHTTVTFFVQGKLYATYHLYKSYAFPLQKYKIQFSRII